MERLLFGSSFIFLSCKPSADLAICASYTAAMKPYSFEVSYRTKSSLGKDSVHDAWDRLEAWLARRLPDSYQALNPPAKIGEIKQLEAAIGQELPLPLRESFRRHNGQKYATAGILFGMPLISVADCLKIWKYAKSYERQKGKKDKPSPGGR